MIPLTIIILDIFFGQSLYNYSDTTIPPLQKALKGSGIKIFKFITDLGDNTVSTIFFLLIYSFSTRVKAFYYVVVVFMSGAINGYLKIAYHHPRPIWTSFDVIAYQCTNSYGFPSGHSQSAALTYSTIYFLLFETNSEAAFETDP